MTYEEMFEELTRLKDGGFDMAQTVTACVYSDKLDDCSEAVGFIDDEVEGFGGLGVWFEDDEPKRTQGTQLINQRMVVQRELVEQDDEWPRRFLRMLTGHECVPCEGSTDEGPSGVLGDKAMVSSMSYYDCVDKLGHSVTYHWKPITDDLAEVVVVSTSRDNCWNGKFDLTRETLAEELKKQLDKSYNYKDGALRSVADRFGIRL